MTTAASPGSHRKSNFFLGFLLLPKAKRQALSDVYAYCRLIDDIVDSGGPKDEARKELDFWREEVERLYAGKPTHAVSRALEPHIASYRIPKEELHEMIRGCAMDLEGKRYETLADLESYMRGVAGSVGVMCVHIFGWKFTPRERILEFATTFGHAFQLTNIIRDVGADLELGRVYLPASDMAEAGYSREKLIHRDHSPAFDVLMAAEHKRAKNYYARARNLVDFRDRPGLAPAEVMGHVYEGLLDEIKARGFRVLYDKTSLPGHRKLALALRGWLYCHGL